MAIFKAVTTPRGTSVGHAKPDKLEDYLKYQRDEDGRVVKEGREKQARDVLLTSLNTEDMTGQGVLKGFSASDNHELALRERFSDRCRTIAAIHGQTVGYNVLKYKHYIQAFPEEDTRLMSREKCHALGVEAAKTFWPGFPVLVATHFDQSGEDGYHWHNHFLVYNCHAETGKKIRTGRAEMVAQKRFVAMQAKANGLTERGLILDEHGRLNRSDAPVKRIGEVYMSRKMDDTVNLTGSENPARERSQRTLLKLCIITAAMKASDYGDFMKRLKDVGIDVKESRGTLSYLHPERRGIYQGRDGWIRGERLGQDYTRAVIERVINEQRLRRNGPGGSGDGWEGSIYEIYFGNEEYEKYKPWIRAGEDTRDYELLNRVVGETWTGSEDFGEDAPGRGL